jgi:acyl-[acyl-carrier-protein]-phospholipid O-acyltransferase/long-chain-fatty-acid--[acyl-carrier-protein] ligase
MLNWILKKLLAPLLKLLFRVRVQGDVSSLAAKRLLIIANHESFLDGLLLGLMLPVEPVFVVYTGVLKSRLFRLVLGVTEYYAVDPLNPMAMKTVLKLVESGRPVMIFPEGRITTTGSLMKVYDGPAFIAEKTGASIVPVRLDGAARTYFARTSGDYPRRLLPRISLTVLPPTRIELPAGGNARERRRRAGEAMRRIMQTMVFSAQPKASLYSAFIDSLEIHGRNRKVLEDMRQEELSYGDLLKMVLALGRLAAKETAPGEAVGVLLPNLAATLGLLLGLSAHGRVPAMLNYTAGADGLSQACKAAGIRSVISSRRFIEQAKLASMLAGLDGVRVLYLEDLRERIGWVDKLAVLVGLFSPRAAEAKVTPDSPAVILFTSGSEGAPKGVVLSHRAILSNIAQIRAVIDMSPQDKFLNALPMFHSFGLTGGTLLPLLSGARIFLYVSPLHYRVIPELAYDRNCSVLLGTSTFLGNYARFAHPYDFYRLRYVIAGAEKLNETVRDTWFEKFGLRILEGYGATETAPVISLNTPMAYRKGSVGQLLPGMEAKLLPVPGIAAGGMLHVRGPNVMSGYLRVDKPGVLQPPSSEAGQGWYETGDIVEVDGEGFLHIRGRVKRFAKVAGEMVSLEVVEKLAASASPQAQHAATSLPDAQRGEQIVLLTTDPLLDREALQAVARAAGVAEIAVPRSVRKIESLPLLGTGKIDYVRVRQLAEQLAEHRTNENLVEEVA